MAPSAHPGGVQPGKKVRWWSTLLKAVGAVSAALSFLLAMNQVTGILQGFRVHHKAFWEAMRAGEQAEAREDYPAAFAGFMRAVELDPIDRKAQEQETNAAMLWLETAHATPNRSFTDTANQLLPVLDRGLANAKGTWAADILAHIAWANFLRYRDGVREGVNVQDSLEQALRVDKTNPYANAMLGFWIMWQGGSIDSANQHFAAALASGRERRYVRDLQVAALMNRHDPGSDVGLLHLANEMRKDGDFMSERDRSEAQFSIFASRLEFHDRLTAILSELPPADMEATVNWLSAGVNNSQSEQREIQPFIVASLREIAGEREQALTLYRQLLPDLDPASALRPQVLAAIQRLSGKSK